MASLSPMRPKLAGLCMGHLEKWSRVGPGKKVNVAKKYPVSAYSVFNKVTGSFSSA